MKLALHRKTEELVAIKILEKNKIKDEKEFSCISRELQALKNIRHSSIVQMYEIFETNSKFFIVMEYAKNGELFQYIMDGKM